jgi:dimethylargininase
MRFTRAITRTPAENFAQGITTSDLSMPDYQRMLVQHKAYINTLESLGLEVLVLDALDQYPDAYFVEDTAVVTPDVAIITNPGAFARKGEQNTIEPLLSKYRQIAHIQHPGTLDGGDVLLVHNHFFIGISERTNREGAEQLGRIVSECGYTWEPIPVAAGLHLKSSVNYIGMDVMLVTQEFADLEHFQRYKNIVLDKSEGYAANTLWVNDTLITPMGFPHTKQKLESLGLPVIELDVSEARKMDGGLTCMSLRF